MEKEMVQKFDLDAAFKALDEIETPKAEGGIRANRVNLKERFAAKAYGDALVEDYYNVNDHEALEEAKDDRDAEVAKAKLARIEKIVDLDAESEEDLLPSYIGKVIIQCPQCMTLFYKNPEDIEKSEENPDVVNINEVCQHCGNASGYTLIGKVGSVNEDETANFETEKEESELNLDFGEPTEEVSPEGTGGGFEEFEETEVVEEGSSDDSSDDELDLDALGLDLDAPVEESVQHEQLNESVKDVVAYVDLSGSLAEKEAELEKAAKDAGATKVEKFTDSLFKPVIEAAKEAKVLLVTGNEDYKLNAPDLVDNENVEVILVGGEANECLKEGLEDKVEAKPEEVLDAAAEAAVAVADAVQKEIAEEKQDPAIVQEIDKEAVKEITDEIVSKELAIPVTPEESDSSDDSSDDALDEALAPSEIENRLTAYAASLGVEEGLKEGIYDVSDAEFKAMLQDKTFQEFGEGLKEEVVTEEKVEEGKVSKAAVDKAIKTISKIGEGEVDEDINITNNDSPSRVDNREMGNHTDETPVEEGILSGVAGLANGLSKGIEDIPVVGPILASDEAEKKDINECAKTEEGLGLFGVGDINVNLDASGQNNAVGVGGGEGKTESCHGEDCKEEASVKEIETDQACAALLDGEQRFTGSKEECEKFVKEHPAPVGHAWEISDKAKVLVANESLLPCLGEGLDDLHEESLNKHISDYLTEVYANVKDFKATNCSIKENKLTVEGTINFNSGKSRETIFEFVNTKEDAGRLIFEGSNKDLAEGQSFTLNCLLEDGGKCLLTESFGYKYTINETLVEGLK